MLNWRDIVDWFEKENPLPDNLKAKNDLCFAFLGSYGTRQAKPSSDLEFIIMTTSITDGLLGWISKFMQTITDMGFLLDKESFFPSLQKEEDPILGKNTGSLFMVNSPKGLAMLQEVFFLNDKRFAKNPNDFLNTYIDNLPTTEKSVQENYKRKYILPEMKTSENGKTYEDKGTQGFLLNVFLGLRAISTDSVFYGNETFVEDFFKERDSVASVLDDELSTVKKKILSLLRIT